MCEKLDWYNITCIFEERWSITMKKETEVGTLEFVQGKYNGNFIGKKTIHLFSRDYEIRLRFDVFHEGVEGLTDEMVKAAKACLDLFAGSTDEIEKKIKEHYDMEVVPIIEDRDEYIEIDSIAQIAQMLRPKELYVTSFCIGLYFECDWDEEEGFGIRFEMNGDIKEMGAGDVVY